MNTRTIGVQNKYFWLIFWNLFLSRYTDLSAGSLNLRFYNSQCSLNTVGFPLILSTCGLQIAKRVSLYKLMQLTNSMKKVTVLIVRYAASKKAN